MPQTRTGGGAGGPARLERNTLSPIKNCPDMAIFPAHPRHFTGW